MDHTPGPWRSGFLDEQDRKERMIVRAEEVDGQPYVAICPNPIIGSHEANARLIAAAPDLLAACEKRRVHGDAPKGEDAVHLLRKAAFALEDIGCRHLAWPVRDLADDIEAAIRKARGE